MLKLNQNGKNLFTITGNTGYQISATKEERKMETFSF